MEFSVYEDQVLILSDDECCLDCLEESEKELLSDTCAFSHQRHACDAGCDHGFCFCYAHDAPDFCFCYAENTRDHESGYENDSENGYVCESVCVRQLKPPQCAEDSV